MNRRALGLPAALLLIGFAAACGGTKRPPAVTTARPPASERTTPSQVPLPVESGPDVAPVDADSARAEDFSVSDPTTGEGGPLADIHFDYDQALLSDQARSVLEKHAFWLQNHREARLIVEGHCDERGTAEYNLALGDQRARATRDYLVKLGVASERLRTVSYGKERPLDPSSHEAAWSRNRRAHFVVSR